MKVLLLGGTRFLGRHLVETLARRGHAVTTFTRGREPASPQACEALHGNRDPRIDAGLAALAGRRFDAVVDLSGYVPRVVRASAQWLAGATDRYLFVSSVSAYADVSAPGVDECSPLATLADASTEDVLPNYGGLKAACEAAVHEVYAARATIVRPGLIVGPYDATDRFGYWVARFVHPHLLGARGPRAVVPAPPSAAVQCIDARDLAQFIAVLVERDVAGTFNAASANGAWTFGDLVAALIAASDSPPEPAWIDDATLLRHGVEPWVGLPLWLPQTEPDHAGFMRIDTRRAVTEGLSLRPLADTVTDTARWLAARDDSHAWQATLGAGRERDILAGR